MAAPPQSGRIQTTGESPKSWSFLPLKEVAQYGVEAGRVLDVGDVPGLLDRAVLRARHLLRQLAHELGGAADRVLRAADVKSRRLDLRQPLLDVQREEGRRNPHVAERGGAADHVADLLQRLRITRLEG